MQNFIKDELVITELFDAQFESVLWMKPYYAQIDNKKCDITDFQICYYNKAAALMMDAVKKPVMNKYLIKDKVLEGKCEDIVFDQSLQVFTNNVRCEFTYYNPYFNKHLHVVRTRIKNGVLSIARDVTNQIIAERKMQEQTEILNGILDASINAVFICEVIREAGGKIDDFRIIRINRAFTQMIGKSMEEVEEKMYLSLFPFAKPAGLFDLNCQVAETGNPLRKEVYYKGENLERWYDISVAKLGDNRLVVTFIEIAGEKQAMLDIQHQNTLLGNILKHSRNGIIAAKIICDENGQPVDGSAILANEAATHITGISNELIANTISIIGREILSGEIFQKALSTLQAGESFFTQYFLKSLAKWLDIGISKMDNNHLIIVFTDITASETVQLGVDKSADQLLSFINIANSGISHLIPVKDKDGEVVDFCFGITNTAFAGYAGQLPETVKGELVSKYYPSYKENGLFDRYKHTYDTEETGRFEKHYKGEGIDAWFDIMCTKMEDGVLVTITDMTILKKLQINLETLVNELKKSNENLQEFAYVASHDLQEPLRKIQVFSERLQKDMGDKLNEENKRVFERMIASTQRMSQLINDLLSYSQLSTKPAALKTINLKDTVQHVLIDLEATINEKKAIISAGQLPEMKGDPVQLRQLFQNLLSNSLKYSKDKISPVVSINSKIVPKEINGGINSYHEIKITDNGIGFEQQHAERIFKVFQRLHGRSEYPGTGIGLAIVQKVVENHHGFITAEGDPGEGSTFKVYLPV